MTDAKQSPSTFDRAELAKFQRIVSRLNERGQYPQIYESVNQEHYAAFAGYSEEEEHGKSHFRRVNFDREKCQVVFVIPRTSKETSATFRWLSQDENNLLGWLRHVGVTDEDLVSLALDLGAAIDGK